MSRSSLRLTLLADGSSDRCLLAVIRWLVGELCGEVVLEARFGDLGILPSPPKSLPDRLRRVVEFYPCDLLFVHRDAEREAPSFRFQEIERAFGEAGVEQEWIPVVPVRMTEAWLLIDEEAIRKAADNPNGTAPLGLPAVSQIERVTDPKQVLRAALENACEKRGRRLDQFRRDVPARVQRVADLIQQFASLRQLSSFQEFEQDTKKAIAVLSLARR